MASKRVDKKNLKELAEKLKINANILKRNYAYTIDQTVNKGQVVLKCTTAGTTDKEALNLSSVSVGDTLTDGTAEWQVISTTGYGSGSGGTSISEWATATSYESGNIVIYGDSLYSCNTDHTSTTFNSDESNWDLIFADIKEWEDNIYYTVGVTAIYNNSLYKCITSHLSTSTFDLSKWQVIGNYITVPIKVGEVGWVSWQYALMSNHLALDGGTVSNFQATYPELYDFFDTNSLITTVQADYDANKALCLYDSVNDEATMPDFLDKTVWGSSTIEEKEAGLPNIKGSFVIRGLTNTVLVDLPSSAFGMTSGSTYTHVNASSGTGNTNTRILTFNAHNSNSIYSDSVNTVQPPAIGLIPQIRYAKDTVEGSVGDIYNDTPIGTVISYMGTTPPREYLSCDGTVYSISSYQALADFIKDEFGSYNYFGGDGTSTFAVPDLRGEFLRGTGTNSHTNQGNGANVGVHQDGTEQNVFVTSTIAGNELRIRGVDGSIFEQLDNTNRDSVITTTKQQSIKPQNTTAETVSADGYYTSRPTNTSVLYCIKYTNSNKPRVIEEWATAEEYIVGDYVLKDNQIYRANTSHTSTTFSADIANWDMISGLQVWTASTTYKANSLVYHGGKLYKVTADFTSTSTFDTTNLELVGGGLSEWEANTSYNDGDILVYDGQIYIAKVDYISSSTFSKEHILDEYTLQTGDVPITWAEDTDIFIGDIVEYNGNYYEALKDFTCGKDFSEYALDEYVPKPFTQQQIEDIISAFNPVQSGSTGFVVYNNAGAHNALYRGKDLTDYFNSGDMSIAIANGSFENIFPGDYLIKSVTVNGTTYADIKWIVGDLDYFLYSEDTECTTHHVLMFPEVCIGTARMNSTNTTVNGYVGSEMWTTTIPKYVTGIQNAFGNSHVLSHRELLTTSIDTTKVSSAYSGDTGISNNWAYTNVIVNIFNENMVIGSAVCSSSFFDTGLRNSQIAAMRNNFSLKNIVYVWWLSSIYNSTQFDIITSDGASSYSTASTVRGVRPYFLLY